MPIPAGNMVVYVGGDQHVAEAMNPLLEVNYNRDYIEITHKASQF